MTQQHVPPGAVRGAPPGANPPNEKVRRASPSLRGVRIEVLLALALVTAGTALILFNFVAPGAIAAAFGVVWLLTAWLLSRQGKWGKAVRNFSRDAVGDESGAASRKL